MKFVNMMVIVKDQIVYLDILKKINKMGQNNVFMMDFALIKIVNFNIINNQALFKFNNNRFP